MRRIKLFMVEKTGKHKDVPWSHDGRSGVAHVPIWRRADTGEELLEKDFPPGACWRAEWYEEVFSGADGKCYCVITPGGQWCIDSRASNCTLPNDNEHNCWCRHGEAPDFTVDKNGNTCKAGQGSIVCGSYHGFLRNGYLED